MASPGKWQKFFDAAKAPTPRQSRSRWAAFAKDAWAGPWKIFGLHARRRLELIKNDITGTRPAFQGRQRWCCCRCRNQRPHRRAAVRQVDWSGRAGCGPEISSGLRDQEQ